MTLYSGKTLSQIWEDQGSVHSAHPLNLSEVPFGSDAQSREKKEFYIAGVMPDSKPAIFHGWFVFAGRAKVWSAYGHEKPEDIYGKNRWVLAGLRSSPMHFLGTKSSALDNEVKKLG